MIEWNTWPALYPAASLRLPKRFPMEFDLSPYLLKVSPESRYPYNEIQRLVANEQQTLDDSTLDGQKRVNC